MLQKNDGAYLPQMRRKTGGIYLEKEEIAEDHGSVFCVYALFYGAFKGGRPDERGCRCDIPTGKQNDHA